MIDVRYETTYIQLTKVALTYLYGTTSDVNDAHI